MIEKEDRIKGVLFGLAAGDRIGGPLRMALCLSESLLQQNGFDADDVFARYSDWYFNGGFDTGPTAARVFRRVQQGMLIDEAVITVDKRANGMTAGCNPMHRAMVLALSSDIADEDLAKIARQEARLSHYHHLAGDVSAATVILCRKLIQGIDLDIALSEIDIQNWLDSPLSIGGFAPHVFKAAIHFLQGSDSFETALGNALGFAGAANYCPVIVGALAGAIYGQSAISQSELSHCGILEQVKTVSQGFITCWE